MRRAPSDIRTDIHRLSDQRQHVYRALAERPEKAHVIAPSRAELDDRLGWLWEELREALSPRGYRPQVIA